MASTAKSPTGDRPSFLGTRVPPTVETMAQYLRELDKDTFRKVLKAVVSALEGKDCRESVKMISETSALSEEQLSFIISGMYTLLREALRLPTSALKQEVFKEDLKDLRIPEDFIVDFVSLVFGNRRPVFEAVAQKQETRLPRLEDFRWRVDVAISTRLFSYILLFLLLVFLIHRMFLIPAFWPVHCSLPF
ncbi:COMM domain-containing protein 5 isoform X2 [Rhinatrema bivittatum]|uniref:COMM domain-containing protein 5 isoform X2 n=1 Tax=Rhinatrema bivittatum TaxID=194408 RepID=UPI001129D025|nr:COMM domain-containing protein 5 isoform X2 [Rhinatrema bivittatum]